MSETETEERDCRNCGRTEFIDLGYAPLIVFQEDANEEAYGDVYICMSCGSVDIPSPANEEVDAAADAYIDILEKNELASEDDIKMMRGIE